MTNTGRLRGPGGGRPRTQTHRRPGGVGAVWGTRPRRARAFDTPRRQPANLRRRHGRGGIASGRGCAAPAGGMQTAAEEESDRTRARAAPKEREEGAAACLFDLGAARGPDQGRHPRFDTAPGQAGHLPSPAVGAGAWPGAGKASPPCRRGGGEARDQTALIGLAHAFRLAFCSARAPWQRSRPPHPHPRSLERVHTPPLRANGPASVLCVSVGRGWGEGGKKKSLENENDKSRRKKKGEATARLLSASHTTTPPTSARRPRAQDPPTLTHKHTHTHTSEAVPPALASQAYTHIPSTPKGKKKWPPPPPRPTPPSPMSCTPTACAGSLWGAREGWARRPPAARWRAR